MTAFRVQPCRRTIPSIRALKESTRFAKEKSRAVHDERGFAFSFASAGNRRLVASKLASLARGSFAQARIAAGLMFTDALKREYV